MRAQAMTVGLISVIATLGMSLTVSAGVLSAPAALDGAATASPLATAERLHPPKPPAPVPTAQEQVVNELNAQRAAYGLAPMQVDPLLSLAAQRHSEDQARTGTMSHVGSDGATMVQRVDRVGFRWRALGENVAYGQPTAHAVMMAWMNSAGHRANNLSSNTRVGAGLALSANGTPYWTLVVGTPR